MHTSYRRGSLVIVGGCGCRRRRRDVELQAGSSGSRGLGGRTRAVQFKLLNRARSSSLSCVVCRLRLSWPWCRARRGGCWSWELPRHHRGSGRIPQPQHRPTCAVTYHQSARFTGAAHPCPANQPRCANLSLPAPNRTRPLNRRNSTLNETEAASTTSRPRRPPAAPEHPPLITATPTYGYPLTTAGGRSSRHSTQRAPQDGRLTRAQEPQPGPRQRHHQQVPDRHLGMEEYVAATACLCLA